MTTYLKGRKLWRVLLSGPNETRNFKYFKTEEEAHACEQNHWNRIFHPSPENHSAPVITITIDAPPDVAINVVRRTAESI